MAKCGIISFFNTWTDELYLEYYSYISGFLVKFGVMETPGSYRGTTGLYFAENTYFNMRGELRYSILPISPEKPPFERNKVL
ncbi:hypothetical protein PAENIP36_56220 [Paenibacillus sp. P36]